MNASLMRTGTVSNNKPIGSQKYPKSASSKPDSSVQCFFVRISGRFLRLRWLLVVE